MPKWVPNISGFASFDQRQELAENHPQKFGLLKVDLNKNSRIYSQKYFYTPKNDKFDGYAQFRKPLVGMKHVKKKSENK